MEMTIEHCFVSKQVYAHHKSSIRAELGYEKADDQHIVPELPCMHAGRVDHQVIEDPLKDPTKVRVQV